MNALEHRPTAANENIDRSVVDAPRVTHAMEDYLKAISRVSDRDPEALRYLGNLGVFPGQTVTELETLPLGGPIHVRIGGAEHLLGKPLAARVNVERLLNDRDGP